MAENTPRRSSRRGLPSTGGRPPVSAVNMGRRGATPASGLSGRTRSEVRDHHELNGQTEDDEARIEAMVLADLGPFEGEEPSPLRRLDAVELPVDYEAAYDRRVYQENAGASDSEDEDDIGLPVGEVLDRQEHIAADLAALMEDIDDIGHLLANNNNNNNDDDDEAALPGAPPGWKPPSAPERWKPSRRDEEAGEPAFKDLDNPGGWNQYCYQPQITKVTKKLKNKSGKWQTVKENVYKHHQLPTGCTVLPKDKDGKRMLMGYEFHYTGWKPEVETKYRSGATKDNLFPQERRGELDGVLLKKMGLTKNRVKEGDNAPDALFFYQLLLPIHAPEKSGIENDPRKGFYTDVTRHTNCYALGELGLGSDYGHHFTPVTSPELLRWDGALIKHGVRGGGKSSMMLRFDKSRADNSAFDGEIAAAMSAARWCEIKRTIKLCDNGSVAKRGTPDYDPAYKYKKIFDVLVHNVNAITKYACLDLCVDESTFGHGGYGPMEDDLFGYLKNKPFTKGGQIVLCCDVGRIRPRAFIHRHNKHKKIFTQTGPNELALIYEKLETYIKAGKHTNPHRPVPIFREGPHITADNHFSGTNVMQYAHDNDFSILMTCRRDRLPIGRGHNTKYVHKEKSGTKQRAKAARYLKPVVAIKPVDRSYFQYITFQSTGPCNFIGVNSLNAVDLYVTPKERGNKQYKRRWAIENNEARQLYLGTYGAIDRMDHYIKNCNMGYR